MSRLLNTVLNLLSVCLVAAGAVLAAALFVPQLTSPTLPLPGSGENQAPDSAGAPSSDPAPAAPQSARSDEETGEEAGGPRDKTLRVTIPGMSRVEGDTVPSTVGDDEQALRRNAAIHLRGTGFPWQEEANVYLAGHRIGYPGTDSFLGFYDLNALEAGDEIYVTDSTGERHTYRVYRERVVRPTNTAVTEPIEGRNILTLQTCTLPDYTQRLVVQAEKVS